MQTLNTQTFLTKLINGEIDLKRNVSITAEELLALMQENIEFARKKNQAILETDSEVIKLRKENNQLKETISLNVSMLGSVQDKMIGYRQQEQIQRNRANQLEQELKLLRSNQPSVKVNYSKGDLLDYAN